MPELLPTSNEERQLHQRLLANDSVAPSILAETYLGPLIHYLQQNNPAIRNPDLIETAAGDAILSQIKNPSIFDPDKSSLFAFLKMAAQGDLKNLLAKEKRLSIGRENWDFVEDSIPDRNSIEPTEEMPNTEKAEQIIQSVRNGLSEMENQVLDLYLNGERKTDSFAKVMGIQNLSANEQAAEVKRMKDKLKKRIERARREYDQSTQ